MDAVIAFFGGLYALGIVAIAIAGLGGILYYIITRKSEKDNETFEKRKW